MKTNAITFNGLGSQLGNTATKIFDFVTDTVKENRDDLDELEVAVHEQMNSGKKGGSRATTPKLPSAGQTAHVTFNGVQTEVALGNINFGGPNFGEDDDSDSD